MGIRTDSTTVYEIVRLFASDKPSTATEWAMTGATFVTNALITNDLQIARAPVRMATDQGYFGKLLDNIAGIAQYSEQVAGPDRALEETALWASTNTGVIRAAFQQLQQNEREFMPWLDFHIPNIWPEHSFRLFGLFERQLIPQIASCLGENEGDVPESDLLRVWRETNDLSTLEDWIKNRPNSEAFLVACDAYVISVLIRGYYHDLAAQRVNQSVTHHPIRSSNVLPKLREVGTHEIPIPLIVDAMGRLILGGSFAERTLDQRLLLWSENVACARKAIRRQPNLILIADMGGAERAAADVLREFGLRTHVRGSGRLIDLALGLVAVGVGHLFVNPWLELGADMSTASLLHWGAPGEALATKIYERPDRYRKLMQSVVGRVAAPPRTHAQPEYSLPTRLRGASSSSAEKWVDSEASNTLPSQYEKAECERRLCRDWLLQLMKVSPKKSRTKESMRAEAMTKFGVSKNAFDFGWIEAIEITGNHDWYHPLPRGKSRRKAQGD